MKKLKTNRVWLLSDPFIALSIRLYLIRRAKTHIRIQTFIWGEDDLSYLLIEELRKAAQRGVKVELMIDGWVGVDNPGLILELRKNADLISSKHYNPPSRVVFPSLVKLIRSISVNARRLNHRMHSKIFCVDGKWSILGGRNYESRYFGVSENKYFRDTEVLLSGQVSNSIDAVFEEFWKHRLSISTENLLFTYENSKRRYKFINKHTKIRIPEQRNVVCDSNLLKDFLKYLDDFKGLSWLLRNKFKVRSARLFYDMPGQIEEEISASALEILQLVSEAKSELVLQTPYLIFSERAHGVFQKLSSNSKSLLFKFVTNSYASNDNIIAHTLGVKERYKLRKLQNVSVYEFLKFPRVRGENEPPAASVCDHAKVLIVDRAFTYIGSSNFDPRSHNINSEIGVLVESEEFSEKVLAGINESLCKGNFFIESKVVDGKNQISFFEHLKHIYLTVCAEPNLPSIGRILFYPFKFLLPLWLKRFF